MPEPRRTDGPSAAPTPTVVRPWTAGDEDELSHFIDRCSAETRFRRFHGLVRHGEATLIGLAELPSTEGATFVAEIAGHIEATGSWVRDEDDRAELALIVADRHQRRGLGAALFDRLRDSASDAGFAAMSAWLLGSNGGAAAFLRAMAPAVETRSSGGGALQLCWSVGTSSRTTARPHGSRPGGLPMLVHGVGAVPR